MNELQQLLFEEARTLERQGRIADAIGAYEAMLTQWPNLANCWFNLGLLRREMRLLDAALMAYDKAIQCGISDPALAHVNRGVIYADYLGDEGAAEAELHRALRLDPHCVPAQLNLANLYEDLGRLEEARTLYELVLNRDGGQFETLARLANLHPPRLPGGALVGRLQSALSKPRATASDRASLGFALGRLLDAAGAYDDAFKAYAAANTASRESAALPAVVYDRASHENMTSRLIRTSTAQAKRVARAPVRYCALPQPVFICGMFRSGSTLTEQMLAMHGALAAGGESDFIPRLVRQIVPFPESLLDLSPAQFDQMAAFYVAELAARFPLVARVTDKRPDNFLYIGFIKTLFPEAKIIHTLRNALDNCLSIYFLHLDHGMSYALDLMDIGHYYTQYLRLMGHWKSLYGEDIFDFDYDAFVSSPAAAAAQLFDFLGLRWHDRYLDRPDETRAVKTASVWQVREPIYTRASGRSANYAEQLADLARYLERSVQGGAVV